MISSTWVLQQFISPTQRMGSCAFKSSVAPASCNSRHHAVQHIIGGVLGFKQTGEQLAAQGQAIEQARSMLFQIPQTQQPILAQAAVRLRLQCKVGDIVISNFGIGQFDFHSDAPFSLKAWGGLVLPPVSAPGAVDQRHGHRYPLPCPPAG